jgi:hypothetical protein
MRLIEVRIHGRLAFMRTKWSSVALYEYVDIQRSDFSRRDLRGTVEGL